MHSGVRIITVKNNTNVKFKNAFDWKPNETHSLGIWIQLDLRAVGFLKMNILQYSRLATFLWILQQPHISYTLHRSLKDDTLPEMYRNKFLEICDHYKGFSCLHTDGSKMEDRVAAAVVYKTFTKTTRLPNRASIFRAELYAISLALVLVHPSKEKKFIIISDSVWSWSSQCTQSWIWSYV